MPNERDTSSNMYPDVDRLIHEPSRYNIMALLFVVERAEYLFVLNQTGMTSGNLTAHLTKLEKVGYVSIEKKFVRKKPKTFLRLTAQGRKAFEIYRNEMQKHFNRPTAGENDLSQKDNENGE